MGNWTKLNEMNKPTIMGVPVPDIIQPSRFKNKAGLVGKSDVLPLAIAGGLMAAGLVGLKKKQIKQNKKSKVPLPKSKPKFSKVDIPVGKPTQSRPPQTLKEQKKDFPYSVKKVLNKTNKNPRGIKQTKD